MIAGPGGLVMRSALSSVRMQCLRQRQETCRLVYGVASLPLGALVELEVIFEVAP